MAAVWKAIYMDPELMSPRLSRTTFGRTRDGYEMMSNMARSLGYTSKDDKTSPRIVSLSDTNNLGHQSFVPLVIYKVGDTTDEEWYSAGVTRGTPIKEGVLYYPADPFPALSLIHI